MRTSTLARELSAVAATAQRSFVRLNRVQLSLLIAAAAVGAVPPFMLAGRTVNVAGLIAALLFGTGLLIRIVIINRRDEEDWFTSRRDADRAKSLCFRYAFGAAGYERSMDTADVEQRLASESASIGSAVVLAPSPDADLYALVSEDMVSVRLLNFESARERYMTERIAAQERWYTARSASSSRSISLRQGGRTDERDRCRGDRVDSAATAQSPSEPVRIACVPTS
jgi:hypothetical protein